MGAPWLAEFENGLLLGGGRKQTGQLQILIRLRYREMSHVGCTIYIRFYIYLRLKGSAGSIEWLWSFLQKGIDLIARANDC
jgi:hypothetical protein